MALIIQICGNLYRPHRQSRHRKAVKPTRRVGPASSRNRQAHEGSTVILCASHYRHLPTGNVGHFALPGNRTGHVPSTYQPDSRCARTFDNNRYSLYGSRMERDCTQAGIQDQCVDKSHRPHASVDLPALFHRRNAAALCASSNNNQLHFITPSPHAPCHNSRVNLPCA